MPPLLAVEVLTQSYVTVIPRVEHTSPIEVALPESLARLGYWKVVVRTSHFDRGLLSLDRSWPGWTHLCL